MTKPKLVSFDLCPFVQRSIITLIEKGVEFEVEYIDLQNKPDWFLKISPFGKVPVLQIDDTVLFESAVINEYLDDIHGPTMHPTDPLARAKNKAWIEFGSNLLMAQYMWIIADTKEKFDKNQAKYANELGKLEPILGNGPFYNGEKFSLIDAAYAPLFQRHRLLEEKLGLNILSDLPKTKAWADTLSERESTKKAVPESFVPRYFDYVKDRDIHLATLL